MGLVEMNDALQRACPAGHWVWWRSMFVAGKPQTEVTFSKIPIAKRLQ